MVNCIYKQNDFCNHYKINTQEIKKQKLVECDNSCYARVEIYSDTDKIALLNEAYNRAKREKTLNDVIAMREVFGHCISIKDDYDYLYYYGYTIWLLVHKKYKYIHDFELITAYECMKLLRMKISKSLIRKLRRKLRPNKKHLV